MNGKKSVLRVLLLILVAAMSLSACQTDGAESQPTEARVQVIMPRQEYPETPLVDYTLIDLPEFVENLEQCTDQTKQYVLPDGYLYAYGSHFVPSATNQLPLATDADGNVLLGCGYQNNARIRSVLKVGSRENSFVTGFIPVKPGDILYLSGRGFDPQDASAHVLHTVLYDDKKEVAVGASMKDAVGTLFEAVETDENGCVTALKLSAVQVPENVAYIRLTFIGSGAGQFISINEPLDEGRETYAWRPVEKYVSSAWVKEIADTVKTVNKLEIKNRDSAPSFLFATDIHASIDPSESYTNDLGAVCAEVMQKCQISFFATGGDNSTQSSGHVPSDFEKNMEVVLEQLEPIPQRNILLSVGNHDGATGARDVNGETLYYRFQLNNEERSAVFFDWQRASNEYKRFDSDGTYYYLDDAATKTRYIVLNSFWAQWEGDEDGFVPDVENAFMQNPHFGPQQLRWFAAEALDMPADYGAVIVTHFAPAAKDFEVFKGIVDAFSSRTTYNGAYVGVEDWQSSEIVANYKYAEGEIIAVFQGHNHEDAQHDFFQNVPCINVTTAGAHWAARGSTALERTKETASEFAVDAVVIDREQRIIYLTRIGAGDDRMIEY